MRLKAFVLSGMLLLLLSGNSFSQTHTARNISMTPNSDGYYEYLPQGYNSGTQTYPLILFIHGMGELGNVPLSALLGGGLPGLINQGQFPASFTVNGQTSSFIVISPHFNPNWPVPTDIQEILDYVVQHYRVDQTRIYMTGLSMGGGVTWDYAGGSSIYANRLAAIVPIAGASWPEPIRGRVIANANLPVWATHNDGDGIVPVSYTNDYIANINAAPSPTPLAKKSIFVSTDHDAWTQTYDPNWKENGIINIYQWMLQYNRSTAGPNPNQAPVANAGPNQTISLPTSVVTLNGSGTDADGTIVSYSWAQVNGTAATITSPSSASTNITGLTTTGARLFALTVRDDKGAAGTSYVTVTVNPVPKAIPGRIEAENWDAKSGPQYAVATNDPNGGGLQVIGLSNGSWMDYNVGVATSGTYTVSFRVATPQASSQYQLRLGTTVLATFNVPNTGAWSNWTTASVTASLTAGNQTLRIISTGNESSNLNWVEWTLLASSTAPVANAGPAQAIMLPVNQVTLAGTATVNNGGSITSHVWSKLSGGSATITDPSNYNTTITGLSAGAYVFRLTVTQNDNQTATSDVAITVNTPAPPTANAGQPQTIILPTAQVTLTGTGAVGNGGTSISYAWTQLSGTAATITNPSSASTTVTGLTTVGTRVFRLTVTQNDNQTATSNVTVIVNNPAPPTANAGTPQTITLPTNQVTLTGTGAVGNGGTTITYAWTQLSGTAASITNPLSASTTVTGLSTTGARVFRLTVTQNDNQTATSDVTITVNNPGPPTANAGAPQTITLPTNLVTLTGTGTVGNNGSITYAWTQISGTAATITNPSSASTTVTGLTTTGARVFRLTVTQNDNQTATSDVTITVNPAVSNGKFIPGKIEAENWDIKSGGMYPVSTTDAGGGQQVIGISNGSWMDYNVTVNQSGTYTVNFRVATTQSNVQFQIKSGATVLSTINIPNTFGWGNWVTVPFTNISLTAGAQTIRILSVSNESCNFNWMDWTLTASSTAPVANAGPAQAIMLPINQVTLSGSATVNNGGSITSHVWSKLSGGSSIITDPSNYNTTITGLSAGSYVFRLTVTQNDNQTGTSDVAITVNTPAPPTANAGTPQTITLPTNQIILTGTGAVGNGGTTISYAWTQLSGTAASITNPLSASTTVTGLSTAGARVFRLTVTQNDNQTTTSDVTITVNNPGPPTANAGTPQTITLPTNQVTLTGTGTVGNNGSITYAWTQLSGTAATITTSLSASTTVTGLTTAGARVFRLTVTQNDNQTATSDVTITVNPAGGNGKFIPGKIEAENWDLKSGGMYPVSTTDAGGGQQVIGISNGSWMDYNVTVNQSGTYTVNFRIATTQNNSQFQIKLGAVVLATVTIPNTFGWGNWATAVVNNVSLTAGVQTLRILSTNNESCNFNWMDFVLSAPTTAASLPLTIASSARIQNTLPVESIANSSITIYPNPVKDQFVLRTNNSYEGAMRIQIIDANGRMMKEIQATKNKGRGETYLSVNGIAPGTYIIRVQMGEWTKSIKMIKQ